MLNVEEMNLLMEFDVSSLQAAIDDIRATLPYVDNHELKSMCLSLLKKLNAMSERTFDEMDFTVIREDNAYVE